MQHDPLNNWPTLIAISVSPSYSQDYIPRIDELLRSGITLVDNNTTLNGCIFEVEPDIDPLMKDGRIHKIHVGVRKFYLVLRVPYDSTPEIGTCGTYRIAEPSGIELISMMGTVFGVGDAHILGELQVNPISSTLTVVDGRVETTVDAYCSSNSLTAAANIRLTGALVEETLTTAMNEILFEFGNDLGCQILAYWDRYKYTKDPQGLEMARQLSKGDTLTVEGSIMLEGGSNGTTIIFVDSIGSSIDP